MPEVSHGQRNLAGYSPEGRKESDTTEQLNPKTCSWGQDSGLAKKMPRCNFGSAHFGALPETPSEDLCSGIQQGPDHHWWEPLGALGLLDTVAQLCPHPKLSRCRVAVNTQLGVHMCLLSDSWIARRWRAILGQCPHLGHLLLPAPSAVWSQVRIPHSAPSLWI